MSRHPVRPASPARCLCLLLGAFGLLAGCAAAAQPRRFPTTFVRLSTGQGLSQSAAQCLAQDAQGFIWVGTQDGLNRYDGYAFKVFRAAPSQADGLSDSYITALCADRASLWVGTLRGLNRYDPGTAAFARFHARSEGEDSPARDRITALHADASGTLWVGTPRGLHRLDGDGFTRFPQADDATDPARSFEAIRVILHDAAGQLWLGSNGGLRRFDPASGTFTDVIAGQRVLDLCLDRRGRLWLAGDGLACFEPASGRLTRFRHDPRRSDSLTSDQTRALAEDAQGRLWVGAWGGGLCRLEDESQGGRFARFRHDPRQPTSLGHDQIWQLMRDRAGTLWVGTDFGGLNRVAEGRFAIQDANPDQPDRLTDNLVWSLAEDAAGNFWAGANEGLTRLDAQGRARRYAPGAQPGRLAHGIVGALLPTRDGALWAGTEQGGLHRLDAAERFAVLRRRPGDSASLSDDWVHALCETRAGALWVGTQRGLDRVDPRGLTVIDRRPPHPDEPGLDAIWAIREEASGALWLGTERGLARWHPGTRQEERYRHNPARADSLANDWVLTLHIDRRGRLWAGTAGGLSGFQLERGGFARYTTANGLPNNIINAILEDDDGRLWLGTNQGLCRLDPETGACRTFDLRDGLPSNEISTGAMWRGADGWLHFGTPAGFFSFHPSKLADNAFVPPVAITGFRIFDRPVTDFDAAQPVTLRHWENFFAFEFAALSFIAPEKSQYAYRLEGFDRDWIACGERRYASYTNLDPGEYVFRVRASNNDGVWNNEGVRVRLRVLPPIWRTGWAYALYAVAGLGLTAGLYRAQARRWRAQAAWREAQLQMQAAQAAQAAADARAQAAAVQAQAARELAQRNRELEARNAELLASQRRADRMFSALADALPGTTLDDKYRLDEKVGAGGFGAVFRGKHLALGHAVAIKVFKPVAGNDSADALERFCREGIAISRLDHPNIVRVLDSGLSQDGIAYLVMELLTGRPLSHELRERLGLRRAIGILMPVCRALAEAHRRGIIHRDIKPDNVFLHQTARGEVVKVVDFGIAKLIGAEPGDDRLTATGTVIGTPAYIAPERVAGQPYDGKSDVYSVGVMAYEMLAGRLPFQATEGNPFAVMLAHLNDAPPPLRQLAPTLPAGVADLVMQALTKKPDARPSADELAARLAEAMQLAADERGAGLERARATEATLPMVEPPPTLPLVADTGDRGLTTRPNLTVAAAPPLIGATRQDTAPDAAPTLIADESADS